MDLTGKKALVLGIGRSGLAATYLLLRHGACLTIYDRQTMKNLSPEIRSMSTKVKFALGDYQKLMTEVFDLVVISPGVPLNNPLVTRYIETGIPVISEIDLAYRLKSPDLHFVAITGTNGKTTTTALVADIIKKDGLPSAAAGNIGLPLAQVVTG